ncbi:MAG TPA: Na+/H+ antiporter NhaC family protein [Candidatus Babeliales bacterium]|nr:Na+/H+ antiporter NhaC family protein [Candidatus Babeliales bacterium]
MTDSWLVLLPPVIVLLGAFTTKNITLALSLGIGSASLVAADCQLLASFKLILGHVQQQFSDPDNLYLCLFVIAIGILVMLFNHSGATIALANLISRRLKTTRSVKAASVLLSCLLFIDDYINCLTVGHVMRPVTDRLKIPRAKLAYLLDSMTAPVAVIAPISSWAGAIVSQLDQSGVNLHHSADQLIASDPYSVYIAAIPFIFYSFITIFSLWLIIYKELSFGLMHQHEQVAINAGNLFAGKAPLIIPTDSHVKIENCSLWDFMIPVATLFGTIIFGILYQGDYWLLGGHETSLKAVFQQKHNVFPLLCAAGITALIAGFSLAFARKKIDLANTVTIFKQGFAVMWQALMIIALSWIFGALLRDDLQTGVYLANTLLSGLNLIYLPAMLFIVTAIISAATGNSWGALAIIIPITIPMVISLLKLATPAAADAVFVLLPSLGAIFSGAAAGGHVSPISDTTVMSANSSGSYLIDHIKTQILYATPAILATIMAFLIAGVLMHHPTWEIVTISLSLGIALCGLVLLALNKFYKSKPML